MSSVNFGSAPRVRTMQIMTGSLIIGVLAFINIAFILRANQPPLPVGQMPILTYLSLFFGVTMLAMQAVFAGIITTAGRRKLRLPADTSTGTAADQDGPWYALYQKQHIIACALLEGAALLALMAYLVEGQIVSPVIAGLMLGALILKFPTQRKVDRWIERQKELPQGEQLGM